MHPQPCSLLVQEYTTWHVIGVHVVTYLSVNRYVRVNKPTHSVQLRP